MIKTLLNDKYFIYSTIIIILLALYAFIIHKPEGEKREDKLLIATKHAIIAYIIAVCAKYDLVLGSSVTVFIFSYFYHDWA